MRTSRWLCVVLSGAGFFMAPLFSVHALAAPAVQQQGAVSFMSGGVGVTEMQEMKGLVAGYPLELLFVAQSVPRRYLSSVKVQIKDKSGKVVLETESQGPLLLAKLPKGTYSIRADNDGKVERRTVQVGSGKTQRAIFVWNQPVDR